MARVDLSSAAQKDLRKILRSPGGLAVKRVILDDLAAEPWPRNLDVASLEAMGSWLRVRAGEFRIVLRPLSPAECKARAVAKGYLVDRVVNRRELERILKAYR
jgi:mRNA-degrading endonuclease RelE of RelBE toxin-antitoxin system